MATARSIFRGLSRRIQTSMVRSTRSRRPGMIAGVMARTDAQRGVWKAPAGTDASLNGVAALQIEMTDAENGVLNPLGINCLRSFPMFGRVVWGARTLHGADAATDEWKYIPVRRMALFLEENFTEEPSGWCLSRMTNRSGRRFG